MNIPRFCDHCGGTSDHQYDIDHGLVCEICKIPREHRYVLVGRYTQSWIADQRDTMDREEMGAARELDAAEPESFKAWRRILELNDQCRGHIVAIHRAQFDLGLPMTPRGRSWVDGLYKNGHRWYDPKPLETKTDAIKALLQCRADLATAWENLHTAYSKEKADHHQSVRRDT